VQLLLLFAFVAFKKILQDDSPDYVNRCLLLANVKNRLETLLSSDIVATFNSKSIGKPDVDPSSQHTMSVVMCFCFFLLVKKKDLTRTYVNIFESMERLSELKKYYYQCQKAKVLDRLNQILATTNEDIKKLCKSWLDYLIEIWHNEVCSSYFRHWLLI
jgi:hypothetical protein